MVALSGGPDSTALLLVLLDLGMEVCAAHYDHRLRPDSGADAEHVAEECRRFGVPLLCGRREQDLGRGSVQAAARRLRYEFMDAARLQTQADCVLLAHTADDLVEGVLMHLLRGSGLAGLRGMPARRGHYRRPLLDAWRDEIEDFVEAAGVPTLRDPSNLDVRFTRAWVRHRLLPRLEADRPGVRRRLHAVGRRAARLQEYVEEAAAPLLPGRLAELRAASSPVRRQAYRRMYAAAGGAEPGLGRRHLEAMDALVLAGRTGAGIDLPGRLRFRVGPARVQVGSPGLPPRPAPELRVSQCPGHSLCSDPRAVHLDAAVAASLCLGRRRPGLRIRPAHGAGSRKLQDVLVDASVPREERDHLPLVFAGERLAWVPGLAVEADFVPMSTRPAVHVSLEEPAGAHARIPTTS